MNEPSAYFISDCHLGIPRKGCEQREQFLLTFLDSIQTQASHLFIGGDLFDFWIEYENLIRADYFPALCALQRLRQRGVEIHYIAGNHDFALGSFLKHYLGIHLHERAFQAEIQGVRVRVEHGDGLLKHDVLYRVLRAILRNPLNQRLYRMLHPTIGIGFATLCSRTSRHINEGTLPEWVKLAYRDAAKEILASSGAEILVLGHTHEAELLRGPAGVYCNTGEWMRRYDFARLQGGQMALLRYAPDGSIVERPAQPW